LEPELELKKKSEIVLLFFEAIYAPRPSAVT
jgi:hypothetical protein